MHRMLRAVWLAVVSAAALSPASGLAQFAGRDPLADVMAAYAQGGLGASGLLGDTLPQAARLASELYDTGPAPAVKAHPAELSLNPGNLLGVLGAPGIGGSFGISLAGDGFYINGNPFTGDLQGSVNGSGYDIDFQYLGGQLGVQLEGENCSGSIFCNSDGDWQIGGTGPVGGGVGTINAGNGGVSCGFQGPCGPYDINFSCWYRNDCDFGGQGTITGDNGEVCFRLHDPVTGDFIGFNCSYPGSDGMPPFQAGGGVQIDPDGRCMPALDLNIQQPGTGNSIRCILGPNGCTINGCWEFPRRPNRPQPPSRY